eukprot:1159130-Pelagomonas_calceolata.AAC.20
MYTQFGCVGHAHQVYLDATPELADHQGSAGPLQAAASLPEAAPPVVAAAAAAAVGPPHHRAESGRLCPSPSPSPLLVGAPCEVAALESLCACVCERACVRFADSRWPYHAGHITALSLLHCRPAWLACRPALLACPGHTRLKVQAYSQRQTYERSPGHSRLKLQAYLHRHTLALLLCQPLLQDLYEESNEGRPCDPVPGMAGLPSQADLGLSESAFAARP